MPKPEINYKKIVVLSGAGLSAPSGLSTFRQSRGLWAKHKIEEVATPEAWQRNPELVLKFYNERRTEVANAVPNAGHLAIAALEQNYEVVVLTQNIDDLHERAGSKNVIHLHGELAKARSTTNPSLIYPIGKSPIQLGDFCEEGSQLRPHVVWFGEDVENFDLAKAHVSVAGRVLVVGTSLSVFPAASLVKYARYHSAKILIDLEATTSPFGFKVMVGSAEKLMPDLAKNWLSAASAHNKP